MAFVKKTLSNDESVRNDVGGVDISALVDGLNSIDPATRRQAARELSRQSDTARHLVDRLSDEEDPSVRNALLTGLTVIGDETAARGLVASLRSDDPGTRNGAIEAMKQMPDAVALIMPELLADQDADVRIFAVNILESLRHPNVEAWLIQVITHDSALNVCATAVDLLSEVGTQAAIVPLEMFKARFSHEPYVSFTVDFALNRIQGESQ